MALIETIKDLEELRIGSLMYFDEVIWNTEQKHYMTHSKVAIYMKNNFNKELLFSYQHFLSMLYHAQFRGNPFRVIPLNKIREYKNIALIYNGYDINTTHKTLFYADDLQEITSANFDESYEDIKDKHPYIFFLKDCIIHFIFGKDLLSAVFQICEINKNGSFLTEKDKPEFLMNPIFYKLL